MTTSMSERDAALVGPRSAKEPGSVAWAWQTIHALTYLWVNLDGSYESYARTWKEADEHEIWNVVPPDDPFGSKEAMLERLAVGDAESAKTKVATLAAVVEPASKPGRPSNGGEKGYHDNLLSKRGTGSAYIMQRIARDNPEVHRRAMNGEFESVAEAARAAGMHLAKRTRSVSLSKNVERVANNVANHYGAETTRRLANLLIEAAENAAK